MAGNEVIVKEKYCYWCKSFDEYLCILNYEIPREQHQPGHSTSLPRFGTGEKGEDEWDIDIYFGGCDVASKDHVSVAVYPYSHKKIINDSNFNPLIKLSIIDKNYQSRLEQSVTLTEHNWESIHFPRFVKRDDLISSLDLQSDNKLKLMCRISCHVSADHSSHSEMSLYALKCRHKRISNYERMFDDPQFSDFQFVVGDTRIKVHKCILAAHSPVFSAMFQSDMIEKKKNEVNIEDIDADVMRQLLRFVYVGEVQDIDDFADKLFAAADKYELMELKDLCEEKLIMRLSIGSLYETLLFVDKYDTLKLKDAAIDFIVHNSKKLSAKEEFKKSIKNLSSTLLAEVICAYMEKSS